MQTTSYIYAASASDIKVTVNQVAVQFPDQRPVMDANRVLIPTRFVAQSLGGKEPYRGKAEGYTKFVQSELSPDSLYTFKVWTENAEGKTSKDQELKIFTRKERIVQQELPTTPETQPIIDEPV